MKGRDYAFYRFALQVVGKNDAELVKTISISENELTPKVWMSLYDDFVNLAGQYKDTGKLFEAASVRVLIAMAKLDQED